MKTRLTQLTTIRTTKIKPTLVAYHKGLPSTRDEARLLKSMYENPFTSLDYEDM